MSSIKSINSKLDSLHVGGVQRAFITADIFLSRIIIGANTADYFNYQFYKKPLKERLTFIYGRRHIKIYQTANGKKRNEVFDSKPEFYKRFSKYINRDWIFVPDCSLERFVEFASQHRKAFAKPCAGTFGIGTYIIDLQDQLEEKYEELKEKKYIIEELIKGDPELQSFNPTSINTIRVITLICADGKPKIMSAGLRMGNGNSVADNFHHGGLGAMIDVNTGIIVTDAVDRDLNYYSSHPLTNKRINGFKIPKWDEITAVVKDAAMVMPEVRFVGWDIALDENGRIMIVEGNCCSGIDISQMPDQKGKWFLYKDEIAKLNKLSNKDMKR
jgi:hypothetical protein